MERITLQNGFFLVPFVAEGSAAIGAKKTRGLNVNALVYTRYNSNNELELVLNLDVLNQIGATVVAENFDKNIPERTEKDTCLTGVIREYGVNDIGLWEGFTLTDAEEQLIDNILKNHDTEGCSVRGTREEIAEEIK